MCRPTATICVLMSLVLLALAGWLFIRDRLRPVEDAATVQNPSRDLGEQVTQRPLEVAIHVTNGKSQSIRIIGVAPS